jgi:hypothetical protein
MTFARLCGIDWISGQDTSPFKSCAIVKFSILGTDVPPIAASVTLQALKHSFRRYGFQGAGRSDEPAKTERLKGGIQFLSPSKMGKVADAHPEPSSEPS